MCEHKWIPYKIEAQPLVCINEGWISTVRSSVFIVTLAKCIECGQVQKVDESPQIKAQQAIDDYRLSHK